MDTKKKELHSEIRQNHARKINISREQVKFSTTICTHEYSTVQCSCLITFSFVEISRCSRGRLSLRIIFFLAVITGHYMNSKYNMHTIYSMMHIYMSILAQLDSKIF